MTWRFKVRGVIIALVILAVLALAAGANWTDGPDGLFADLGF